MVWVIVNFYNTSETFVNKYTPGMVMIPVLIM